MEHAVRDIHRQLQGVTLDELQQRVDSFLSRPPGKLTDSELRAAIYNIVLPGGIANMTFTKSSVPVPAGTDFFRGRKIFDLAKDLRTTADVWQPAPAFVRSAGRLNSSGESILYTSREDPTTAVHECRFEVSDMFAMTRFSAKEAFESTRVGEDPATPGLNADDIRKLGVIQGFLDQAFSAKADAANPDPYRLSRFIAYEFFDLPPDLMKGWAFRSVMDPSGNGWNFSFRPGIGRKALRYKETHVYRLVGFNASGHNPLTELVAAFEPARGERLSRLSPARMDQVASFWP